MARKKRERTDELLAELVKGKSPEEILGEGGVRGGVCGEVAIGGAIRVATAQRREQTPRLRIR